MSCSEFQGNKETEFWSKFLPKHHLVAVRNCCIKFCSLSGVQVAFLLQILDRLHDAGYVPGHTQSSFSSQRATRSPSPQRRGVPGTFLQLLQLPERAWVERFRSVVRVCGVGEDQGQARARHVELMNACLPEWDFRWQKNVSAAGKVFHRAGAAHANALYV